MAIIRITSGAMVSTIENQIIANRLNATKTQVMCLRTKQKNTGGEYDLKLKIKGKEVPEKSQDVLLGLNWDMGWTESWGHVDF